MVKGEKKMIQLIKDVLTSDAMGTLIIMLGIYLVAMRMQRKSNRINFGRKS